MSNFSICFATVTVAMSLDTDKSPQKPSQMPRGGRTDRRPVTLIGLGWERLVPAGTCTATNPERGHFPSPGRLQGTWVLRVTGKGGRQGHWGMRGSEEGAPGPLPLHSCPEHLPHARLVPGPGHRQCPRSHGVLGPLSPRPCSVHCPRPHQPALWSSDPFRLPCRSACPDRGSSPQGLA